MARGGMPKLVQAKDIPPGPILAAVYTGAQGRIMGGMLSHEELVEAVKAATGVEYPYKVVRAKAGQMMKQKLIFGCICGCRGNWALLEKGAEVVTREYGDIWMNPATWRYNV